MSKVHFSVHLTHHLFALGSYICPLVVFQKKNDQHLQALKAYIRIVADSIIIAAGTVD